MTKQFKSLVGEIQVDYHVKEKPKAKIKNSEDAVNQLKPLFKRINYKEQAYMLLLNRANNTLGWVRLSEGGIFGTVMDIRIILQHALMAHATGIILAHNHPSGNLNPSQQDIQITRQIRKGTKLLEIGLLDHIIITSNSFYSMADNGII
ncbi:MAG: JAB domain-containing protein [Ekhidna sp.]